MQQSFTARMLLPMATSAPGLGRRCYSFLMCVIYTLSVLLDKLYFTNYYFIKIIITTN